jgi:hypothetical protein
MNSPETRTEVFDAIAQNDDYMTEFMENLYGNQHTMQMMQGNKKMMGNMMQGEGMQMMMKDSMMIKNMMQGMMKDGKMMGTMMQMMHEKGMMSGGLYGILLKDDARKRNGYAGNESDGQYGHSN